MVRQLSKIFCTAILDGTVSANPHVVGTKSCFKMKDLNILIAFYREGQTAGRAGQKQDKPRTDRTNAEQTGQRQDKRNGRTHRALFVSIFILTQNTGHAGHFCSRKS